MPCTVKRVGDGLKTGFDKAESKATPAQPHITQLNLPLTSLPVRARPAGEGGESRRTLQGDKREIGNPVIREA